MYPSGWAAFRGLFQLISPSGPQLLNRTTSRTKSVGPLHRLAPHRCGCYHRRSPPVPAAFGLGLRSASSVPSASTSPRQNPTVMLLLHPSLRPPRYAAIGSHLRGFGNPQSESAFTPYGIDLIERLWAVMHQHVTHNRAYSTQKLFTEAIMKFFRKIIPKRWHNFRN